MHVTKTVTQVPPGTIDPVLHISNLKMKKAFQKLTRDDEVAQRNARLEATRARQLLNFDNDVRSTNVKAAVTTGTNSANTLRSADIDQVSYLTKAGRKKAQAALVGIGVDVKTWGPFDPVKKEEKKRK
jgi:hypothetical protein